MKCYYTFKNRTFESELALDDFLLSTKELRNKYGDEVFSVTAKEEQVHIVGKLQDIAKEAEETDRIYETWKALNKVYYGEDGEVLFDNKTPPRIGVNRFLRTFKKENGDRLFPEFIEREYWLRRVEEWKLGNFSDDEKALIIDRQLVNIGTNLTIPAITDTAVHKQIQDLMEEKWAELAKAGTAIHEVLEYYFASDDQGTRGFELSNVELYISSKITLSPYLTPLVITDTIKVAEQIKLKLENEYGDNLLFYPEFSLTADTNDPESNKSSKLYGIIDLLVIDKKGKVHIVDYKTSVHSYNLFRHEKKLTYRYQISTYQRMLERHGINIYGGDMYVAPLRLNDFQYNGSQYTLLGVECPTGIDKINDVDRLSETIFNNIDKFMPVSFHVPIETKDLGTNINKYIGTWIPAYNRLKTWTAADVREELGDDLKKDKDGNFTYNTGSEIIMDEDEVQFINKIILHKNKKASQRARLTSKVKNALKQGILLENSNVEFPAIYTSKKSGDLVTWLQDTLLTYCNSEWEVEDHADLEAYGILTLKNKRGFYDFVRVSPETLTHKLSKRKKGDAKRTNLAGAFISDLEELSKSDSLMVDMVEGNAELMEMMVALNSTVNSQGLKVGKLLIVNPMEGKGIKMSNKELAYCWATFNKYHAVENDHFANGDIKLMSITEQATELFRGIMQRAVDKDFEKDYIKFKDFKPCTNMLDEAVMSDDKKEAKIKELQKVISLLENGTFGAEYKRTHSTLKELNSDNILLYNTVLQAILELRGYNFRQQLKDHDSFIDSWNLLEGHSGNRIDNPGNLSSETLNVVTKAVTEAYQNTRDVMVKEQAHFSKLLEALKRRKGFSKFNFFSNLVSLYTDMIREIKGEVGTDIVFKKPEEMGSEEEKLLLEYVLKKINENRYGNDPVLEEWKKAGDLRYYRVPLARGGEDSVAVQKNLFKALKAKFKYLSPAYSYQKYRDEIEGVYNSEDSMIQQKGSETIYEMTNIFDSGEDLEKRSDKIEALKRDGSIEYNLETLLYKHIFAYNVQENINKVFPLIKTAVIHLKLQGATQNEEFKEDISYMEDYIRNKILNKSLAKTKAEANILKVTKWAQQAASFTALAFAPVQVFYQPLLGLWQTISLRIRKPNGSTAFTFSNFTKASKMLMQDFTTFSDKPTVMEMINKQYGINDMDMNTYVEKFCKAKSGIWNLSNLAFKFASRPDFYNRMLIIGAQMIEDGSMEAHSINDNNELVYDWKKDKRFEIFAKSLEDSSYKNHEKYHELRALYYAVAKLFEKEHAKNADGSDFEVNMNKPMALPRAYTNKESEGMKSLTDDIYGYYSHEKKSLIMSSTIGSLWLLFKTYWSGKKNQWLQTGAVRNRGKFEHYYEYKKDSNGNYVKDANGNNIKIKYYYQVDNDGTVKYEAPPIADDGTLTELQKTAPVIQWKGQWLEGIITTMADIIKDPAHWRSTAKYKWNHPDENVRNAYRSNFHLLWYDLVLFLVGGVILSSILKDLLKDLLDPKNDDPSKGLALAALNIGVKVVGNSFIDFNPISSVIDPLTDWTPFAFLWGGRVLNTTGKVVMGETDAWDAVINLFAFTKQTKPFFDSIKPEYFRTPREGGHWGEK